MRTAHIYAHKELLLSHKNEGNIAICSNMDGSREIHLVFTSQTKTNVCHVWNLKDDTSELTKQKDLTI